MSFNGSIPHFYHPTAHPVANPNLPPPIQQVLQSYSDIFSESTTLPPFRPGFDHQIPLKEDTAPFNIRPYRYSTIQKNMVDQLIDEMLNQGIIQHSTSTFVSPIVLVRKNDGTWRLCVDYRRLNQSTIKDRFPIPLIDDLMDELGGAIIFLKLDLKSGYHQVRMAPVEESKTAFKTHNGHFEYLVMPFSLSNAPTTFQALMNYIFKPFLRKFIIIFFDDILIYSKIVPDHVTHLTLAFQTIREHSLYLNKHECCFATPRVEYLGHFISAEGEATDPSKILAITSWPLP